MEKSDIEDNALWSRRMDDRVAKLLVALIKQPVDSIQNAVSYNAYDKETMK